MLGHPVLAELSEGGADHPGGNSLSTEASNSDSHGTNSSAQQDKPSRQQAGAGTLAAPAPSLKPAANAPAVGSGVTSADPFVVISGLLFVIAMIFVAAWLMRRLGSVSMAGGQAMKIVSVLSVGPREKVLLVDVAGRQILLGVAPGRVSYLQSFDQPVFTPAATGSNEFATKIKQLLHTADTNTVKKS